MGQGTIANPAHAAEVAQLLYRPRNADVLGRTIRQSPTITHTAGPGNGVHSKRRSR
jgi:hypothetical protein